MTGAEHYRKAETLLGKISDYLNEDRDDAEGIGEWAAIAQVHATLALAAATAMGLDDMPAADWDQWRDAASAYMRPQSQPVKPAGGAA